MAAFSEKAKYVERHYKYNDGRNSSEYNQWSPTKFNEQQDYNSLARRLRESKLLFEDDAFPANGSILTDRFRNDPYMNGNFGQQKEDEIKWLRPHVSYMLMLKLFILLLLLCCKVREAHCTFIFSFSIQEIARKNGKNPKMFVDGVDRFDVNKGKLNNSWFLAAVTNLAEDSEAFLNVVPRGQGFTEEETNGKIYLGMFKFRFFRFGKWFEV